jgi:hypothetical protein
MVVPIIRVSMLFTLGLLFASRRLTCWAVVAAALCQLTVVADDKVLISERIDGVINGAARLGVPVLAVASTDSCRDGPVLKRRLANNPSLQPLVARFAIVELRMSGNDKWEWNRWQGHFDIRRRNTPQLFVIRADGRVSFSGDPPAELAGFLRAQLDSSGQPITTRQADQFEARLRSAAQFQEEGNLAGAVGAVMPAVRMPSFARPIVQSVAFRAAVARVLLERIERVGDGPDAGVQDAGRRTSATEHLAAVEEIVAASEQFVTTLPEVARAASKRLAEISREPDGTETVRNAQLLHRAAFAARTSADRGLALYHQIIAMHPDSPAAELAATRIEKR